MLKSFVKSFQSLTTQPKPIPNNCITHLLLQTHQTNHTHTLLGLLRDGHLKFLFFEVDEDQSGISYANMATTVGIIGHNQDHPSLTR